MTKKRKTSIQNIVVIGSGMGGLTAAAVLAKAGYQVTVLEAQVYPGGCAGTFFHKGYRFDAGATLAGGFYPDGPMDLVAHETGVKDWHVHPVNRTMLIHLPDGSIVTRYADETRWEEHRAAFGDSSLKFFQWQEKTANQVWNLALRLPPWLPETPGETGQLLMTGLDWMWARGERNFSPSLIPDAIRPLKHHLQNLPDNLKDFVDAQLLISAQVTSDRANALYGAAALDLPRRGVVHVEGGMGALAETLVQAVFQNGGRVLYRQEATRIRIEQGKPVAVETGKGNDYPANLVISNLTPWNTADLLESPPSRLPNFPADGWGAFMMYVGMTGNILPEDFPLHHQVVLRRPFGEGNTIFASFSPAWDPNRAPAGHRALTISTHTRLKPWWQASGDNRKVYESMKAALAESVLDAAEKIVPGLRNATQVMMTGTPVTFHRYTRRKLGWVGGFPQTSLVRPVGARFQPGIWLVGDSVFPGQSIASVALGGLRVAKQVIREA